MNGWAWAGATVLVMVIAIVAFGYALHRGEKQDRAARRTDPHAAYWGTGAPNPTRTRYAPHTPAWARHNTRRHRR